MPCGAAVILEASSAVDGEGLLDRFVIENFEVLAGEQRSVVTSSSIVLKLLTSTTATARPRPSS